MNDGWSPYNAAHWQEGDTADLWVKGRGGAQYRIADAVWSDAPNGWEGFVHGDDGLPVEEYGRIITHTRPIPEPPK